MMEREVREKKGREENRKEGGKGENRKGGGEVREREKGRNGEREGGGRKKKGGVPDRLLQHKRQRTVPPVLKLMAITGPQSW